MPYCGGVGVDESLLWYQHVKTVPVVLLSAAVGGPATVLLVGPTAEEIIILIQIDVS